jgi:uncharacterized protein (TIGR03067 family)
MLAGTVFSVGGQFDAATAGGKADAPADTQQFQGHWKTWRSQEGWRITADSGDGMLIEGQNIQFLWNVNNKGGTATFTLNPKTEPKEIDLQHTSGSLIGQKQLGIYRFTGDGQLEISWAGAGATKRPAKFTGKLTPGAGKVHVIYRSGKFKLPEVVTKEFKALEGRWKVTQYHRFGRPEANVAGRGEGAVIEDDDLQFLWRGDNKGAKSKFLVDPAKNPKQIEIVYTVGSERYHKRIGIYKLDGNKLEVSLSAFDADVRPTALTGTRGTPGAGDVYYIFERVKE